MTSKQKWLATLRWLRRNFPVELPVRVRSIKTKKNCGFVDYLGVKKGFLIRIGANQSLELRLDTIVHEWAHVRSWFGAEAEIEDHGAEWGIAYAFLYRTFLEWDFGRNVK